MNYRFKLDSGTTRYRISGYETWLTSWPAAFYSYSLPPSPMFNVVDYPDQNLLRLTMAGKLTKEDYASVVPTLEAKIKRFGKANVYLEVGSLDAATLPALWEELKQDVKHFADFNRAAVVSDDSALLKAATAVTGTITPAEVKHFSTDQKAEALRWTLGADPTQLETKQVYSS